MGITPRRFGVIRVLWAGDSKGKANIFSTRYPLILISNLQNETQQHQHKSYLGNSVARSFSFIASIAGAITTRCQFSGNCQK